MVKKLALVVALWSLNAIAQASDHGCTVLLCMANPGGPMKVAECVPPMKKLFKDLAKGKPFPGCDFSKSGSEPSKPATSYADHKFASKNYCHPDYYVPGEPGYPPTCKMSGAVTVTVEGIPTQRVWWTENGDSVTETWNGSVADNFADPIIETPPPVEPSAPATPLTRDEINAKIAYLNPIYLAEVPKSVASYKALEDCVHTYGRVQDGYCQAELAFHAATADPIKAMRDQLDDLRWLLYYLDNPK
ncbi:hypothetical protein RBA41_31325 [Massilia sp. CCM 9210]|uniref:hypothetical protein n=1 Tax=Massilia scottii TaxID=3057166 RepID=UPI0027964218|nr:hypothetical protein [Massilia sp. CCM 9210]MDQ1817802.1 hypothetical protein [Massilia sp. CCM 9210]